VGCFESGNETSGVIKMVSFFNISHLTAC
jgi:hypothetical protein